MAKRYIVQITGGTSTGPYNIYYDVINPNNFATDVNTSLPASGLSYSYLSLGIQVEVPDSAAVIIVYNVDCNIFSGTTVLSPIVNLTVKYEACSDGGKITGRFIFYLDNPLGNNLTINESTLNFLNNVPLLVRENNTGNSAKPLLPFTLPSGSISGITGGVVVSNNFPYTTSKIVGNDIIYNGLIYSGGTQWTMPNTQIVDWFTTNNPQLNINFEPDPVSGNTFCKSPTPTPTQPPTSTPTPTPSPTQLPTSTPTPTPTPTGGVLNCDAGIDVVFVVDYTASMGTAINDIKNSITAITNTVVTESNNDYRLGLVIFDENVIAPNYLTFSAYTSLPVGQRFTNTNGGLTQYITAMEMMSTNNETSFTNQLNRLNTNTDFPLGNGIGGAEPGDIALNLIINQNFAGVFRSNVSRFIIFITDNNPSGINDTYDQPDVSLLTGLTLNALSQQIRVILMRNPLSGGAITWDYYNHLATGSTGFYVTGFTPTQVIRAIQDICQSSQFVTPTPTPSIAPTLPPVTRSPRPSLQISNYTTNGRIDGISPAFYTITDDFPVISGQIIYGSINGPYSSTIAISLIGPSGGGSISLIINNVEVSCKNVPFGVQTVSFTSGDYPGIIVGDRVEFNFQNGVCN